MFVAMNLLCKLVGQRGVAGDNTRNRMVRVQDNCLAHREHNSRSVLNKTKRPTFW